MRLLACLIVAPQRGYDEPAILSYAISSFCPTSADGLHSRDSKRPATVEWLHEIKHDGFRIIARKTGAQVRLYSRPGNDLTRRFPHVETLARLRSRSCIIDGEAVACDDNG